MWARGVPFGQINSSFLAFRDRERALNVLHGRPHLKMMHVEEFRLSSCWAGFVHRLQWLLSAHSFWRLVGDCWLVVACESTFDELGGKSVVGDFIKSVFPCSSGMVLVNVVAPLGEHEFMWRARVVQVCLYWAYIVGSLD